MIQGRFGDTSKSPYVEGRLRIPGLRIESNVSFLVDTGAESTVLLPEDVVRMKLDYSALSESGVQVSGIGGSSPTYVESAIIMFTEPGVAVYSYEVKLLIVELKNHKGLPSLLGRDILSRWRMNYSPIDNQLEFEVVNADKTYPLTRGSK